MFCFGGLFSYFAFFVFRFFWFTVFTCFLFSSFFSEVFFLQNQTLRFQIEDLKDWHLLLGLRVIDDRFRDPMDFGVQRHALSWGITDCLIEDLFEAEILSSLIKRDLKLPFFRILIMILLFTSLSHEDVEGVKSSNFLIQLSLFTQNVQFDLFFDIEFHWQLQTRVNQ